MTRSIVVLSLGLALAGALTGCGKKNLCEEVACEAGSTCNLADGLCHCGGPGGEVCEEGQACDPLGGRCLSGDGEACDGVLCGGGTACDPTDGLCKCGGTGGEVCDSDARCETTVGVCLSPDLCSETVCPSGESCDPATGACTCGGVVCTVGERCELSSCVTDPCFDVRCSGGASCDATDGTCRCGGSGGPTCANDEVCDPDAGACLDAPNCLGVVCSGGTSCDPTDGACKCGGAGGTACAPGQVCDLSSFTCEGGDPCLGATCSGGTTCDPEDGLCRCGGLGGPECAAGTVCVNLSDEVRFCSPPCAPAFPACESGEACYHSEAVGRAFCTTPGFVGANGSCTRTLDCGPGLHCVQRETESARCEYYCDVESVAPQPGACPPGLACDPIFPSAPDLGVCTAG